MTWQVFDFCQPGRNEYGLPPPCVHKGCLTTGITPNKIVHLSSICHVPDTVCVISANAHNNPGGDPSLPPFIGEPAKHKGEGTGPKSHSWQVAEPGHCLTQSQCLFTTPTPPSCCRQTEPQTWEASWWDFGLRAWPHLRVAQPSPVPVGTSF